MNRRKDSLGHLRGLLRKLDDPSVLLREPLVIAHFRKIRRPIPSDPHQLKVGVREFVTAAVALLPPRHRAIITRADLGGEVHRAIAASLGISQRYFYKERRRALIRLAELLAEPKLSIPKERLTTSVPIADKFEYVEALTRIGNVEPAIAVLETLVSLDVSANSKLRAAHRLAVLLADIGSIDEATRALDGARRLLSQSQVEVEEVRIAQDDIDFAEAKIAWLRSKVTEAEERARRLIGRLKASFSDNRKNVLLASALLLLFDILSYRGAFAELLDVALDAQEALEKASDNSVLTVRALAAAAYAKHHLAGTTTMSLQNLAFANSMAMRMGAVRESLSVTTMLCGMYVLREEAKRGLDLALPMMATARFISPAEALNGYFNVALAASLSGEARTARSLITQAMSQLPPNSSCPPLLQLAAVEAAIKEREFAEALSLVSVCRDYFERTSSTRLIGHTLYLQALAYSGLGRGREALHVIRDAVKTCEQFGSPFSRYRAYSISFALSGKRAHAQHASDLIRSLQA